MKSSTSTTRYLFKVNLKRAKGIWRKLAMRGDETLDDLHNSIFDAFDRYDPHLYSFFFPKAPSRGSRSGPRPKEYTAPSMFDEPDLFGDEDRFNAADTRLDDLRLKVRQRFEYLFDFGDSWWHEVTVETIAPVSPNARYGIVERKGVSPAQYEEFDE